ncbi:DUF1264-domain-containing protein [Microthyrium microscopicum]|uniref:DUF1264-domain-containing protein n=1 Tax=Microthyrium microscopicum TaxID=703497 RepID=A0A6A6TV85_9PEZI|nr:DUF1264-domain-containing protein [Microthyrium microscopicum]
MNENSTSNNAAGAPESLTNKTLETAASLTQDLAPVKRICAHLNAFHAYASDTSRFVEANHYCSHINEDMRQCIIYDSPDANARLIGIEYMISPRLYNDLPQDERKLWHSHVFEVKSGMLIMPKPAAIPEIVWEAPEGKEMEDVVTWYGKVYHLWQVDRGDKVPLGEPQLMTSFTNDSHFPQFEKELRDRDARFGSDFKVKKEARKGIEVPEIHGDADQAWKA